MSITITNLITKDIEKVLKKKLTDDLILVSIANPEIDESCEDAKFINDSSIAVLIGKYDKPTSWDERVLKLAKKSQLHTMCDMIDKIHNAGWLAMIMEITKYYVNRSECKVNWLAVTWVMWKYEILHYGNYSFIDSKRKLLDLEAEWKKGK